MGNYKYTVVDSEAAFNEIKNLARRLGDLASIIQNPGAEISIDEAFEWIKMYKRLVLEMEVARSKALACLRITVLSEVLDTKNP
jgi:hypothetical protein